MLTRTIATKIIRFRTSLRLGIFLGGDLDEEESGDAYWRRREIAMPDNEGGARLDIPDDPFDGWGYMSDVDHCERCGAPEG